MISNSIFDWYNFYKVGCRLYEQGSEEDLRTAINRFYYGSFCYARDYFIKRFLFHLIFNNLLYGVFIMKFTTKQLINISNIAIYFCYWIVGIFG